MIRTFSPLTPYELASKSLATWLITTSCMPYAASLAHDRRLIVGRVLEDSVQRNDGRHPQRVHEIEDVAAVVAAEDAVLVLDRDQAHATVVHELRSARVVGLDVLPNLELDLGRILVLAAGSVTASTIGCTRRSSPATAAARSAVKVAMPQRRGP